METKAHYVLIGAFMLAGVAALALFVLWLGRAENEWDEYEVVFTERVSGLAEGGDVRFNGIKVGDVRDLRLDPNDPNRVLARIRVSDGTPVKVETRATLELVGITGMSLIQLTGGEPNSPLLKTVSSENVPRIEADVSGFAMLLESSNDIVAAVDQLLAPENLQNIADIVSNVRDVSGAIAERKEEIGTLIESLSTASANITETTATLNRSLARIDRLLAEEGQATFQNLDTASEEARLLLEDIRATLDENRGALREFSEQGLSQFAPTLVEARRVLRSLDSVLREVERDPRGFLFGGARPEYSGGEE